jgi:hypothetical protein
MALSVMVEFLRPIIEAVIEDPEERRNKARQYLRDREDDAKYKYAHTTPN